MMSTDVMFRNMSLQQEPHHVPYVRAEVTFMKGLLGSVHSCVL